MCDDCREKKAGLLLEIAALASREGEAYEELVEAAGHDAADEIQKLPELWVDGLGDPTDESIIAAEILECSLAQAIGIRAACIASLCHPATSEGNCPPSIILGIWAGYALQAEATQHQLAEIFESMFGNQSNN